MSSQIKIVVADNYELFRKALVAYFKEIDTKIKVVGEVSSEPELTHVIDARRPNVVLLDLNVSASVGEETIRNIQKRHPSLPLILLADTFKEREIAYYMSKGILACLPKKGTSENLLDAIYNARNGQPYFVQATSKAVLNALLEEKRTNTIYKKLRLSTREIEVLKEICKGSTSKEISKTLNVVPKTIDFHRARLYKKTGTKNVVRLALYAAKTGIIQL